MLPVINYLRRGSVNALRYRPRCVVVAVTLVRSSSFVTAAAVCMAVVQRLTSSCRDDVTLDSVAMATFCRCSRQLTSDAAGDDSDVRDDVIDSSDDDEVVLLIMSKSNAQSHETSMYTYVARVSE